MLVGGLAIVAVGGIFPSSDPVVALGWLLFVPVQVSLCGVVFVFVGLARGLGRAIRTSAAFTIVRLSAVAGVGIALGYLAAGIASQVPDSIAGLNGPFVPGASPALGVFLLCGIGLSAGLLVGAVAVLVLRFFRSRRPPAEVIAGR